MVSVKDLYPEIGSIIAQSVPDTVSKKVVLKAKVKRARRLPGGGLRGRGVWRTVALQKGAAGMKLLQRVHEISRSLRPAPGGEVDEGQRSP